jgi:hypothetical protein
MRPFFIVLIACGVLPAAPYRDPDGFALELPAGWRVNKFGQGGLVVQSADPARFAMILPVLGRNGDCAATLRQALTSGWSAFPAIADVQVQEAGPRSAVAGFTVRQRQGRGAMLCAETGPRSAMFYGLSAPAAQYGAERAALLAILKSFRYTGRSAPAAVEAPMTMEPWREPSEGAYQSVKPAGWQVGGGVRRISNNDVRVGVQLLSPDRTAAIFLGDTRLNKCFVPGTFSSQYGSAPLGVGVDRCPYRDGVQLAEFYAARALASDWRLEGLRFVGRRPRPDLNQLSTQASATLGQMGMNQSYGEVRFAASRGGVPVEGVVIAASLFASSGSADPNGGMYTSYVTGYLAPSERAAAVGAAANRVMSSARWDYGWITGNRQAAINDTRMALAYNRQIAALGQRMFEERDAADQRRADAAGHLLSGTVELQGPDGQKYQAKAGSNYYYLDTDAARRVSNPNDAVARRDVWDRDVDLQPLAIVP